MKERKPLAILVILTLALVLILSAADGGLLFRADAAASDEIQSQIDQMREEQKKLQQKIDSLEAQKSETLSDIQSMVTQKNTVEQQLVLLSAQIRGIQQQLSACNVLIADKQEQLDQAKKTLADLNQAYKLRIRAMEEDGNLSAWLVLFRANSLTDFLDRMNMIQEIAAADRRRLQEISDAAALVEQTQEALKSQRLQLQQMQKELSDTQADMDKKSKEADALLQQLLQKKDEYDALIQESADRKNALLDELAQKEKEFDKAKEEEAYQQWLSTSVPADVKPDTQAPGGNFDASGIYWVIPTKYLRVSSPFSDGRLHPILGYVRPHKGIDLAAYTGTPIYATRSGTVTVASTGVENGNYVFINHGDGFSSAYLHMHYYTVEAGEYVQAGQQIGVVGNTGLSKGSHLHFSIIHNGTYVNPAQYVDFY